MQLNVLMRSASGMAGDQCIVSNDMCGLRGGRELQTTRVANQAGAGRSCTGDWTGEVPAKMDFRNGGAGNDKGAWWWHKEAAMKSWRRDLSLQVSSLVSGLNTQYDYSYPRGTLHRGSTGRSWAVNNTSNVYEVE
jgi:hypothetical protein